MSTTLVNNITIYNGTEFNTTYTWWEEVLDSETGNKVTNVVDMTGWNAQMGFKSDSAYYHISTISGEIVLNNIGEIAIIIPSTQTANYETGTYKWDLLLKSPTGDILPPLLKGTLTIVDIVTQWQT